MNWDFRVQPAYLVESEVTQRDQFKSDELDLSEAFVREPIQNSLDAAVAKQVRVRFAWRDKNSGLDPDFFFRLFDNYLPHARAAGIEVDNIDFQNPTALVVEDFGTCGLTGAVDRKDDGNFSDFWRRHGRSHKTGSHRGRWGLGKLVFSTASSLGAFFGLTVRNGENCPLLMGQSVLNHHELNGSLYPPHAFFAAFKDDPTGDPNRGLPVPLTDHSLIEKFRSNLGLRRTTEPGLSIVIPFPISSLDRDLMVAEAILNYFFPILTGQLVVDFDGEVLEADTLRNLFQRYGKNKIADADALFQFVEGIRDFDPKALLQMADSWTDRGKLTDEALTSGQLSQLRESFRKGELVGVNMPIEIKKKNGISSKTQFALYLKRPDGIQKGRDLYVRGGITVPGEAKFHERKSLGALVATEEAISEFLGDAENPAHTKWNGQAEKLQNKYKYPAQTLRHIRNSLVELHDLIVQAIEEEDERALLQFFWAPGLGPRKRKETPPGPGNIPEPKPQPVRIDLARGGFTILPTRHLAGRALPLECSVEAAYDLLSGNPFRRYDPLDFDFQRKGDVTITAEKVTVKSASRNRIDFTIDAPDFRLDVTGFDPNRDVVVRVGSES
ncbi:MAG: hypothetical protein NNA22_10920 [Nitrospira sp.]|nr:hypothetical protein [Nitrospira sp.]